MKELHKTFYDEYPDHSNSLQRASAAQILLNNRESAISIHNAESKKQEKTKLTKLYMNVDKIRNLKVSNREKNKLNYQSSYFKN